jgi:hypothetical protein
VNADIAEGLGLADARGALVTDVPEGPRSTPVSKLGT